MKRHVGANEKSEDTYHWSSRLLSRPRGQLAAVIDTPLQVAGGLLVALVSFMG